MARDAKVILEYRNVIEPFQSCRKVFARNTELHICWKKQ